MGARLERHGAGHEAGHEVVRWGARVALAAGLGALLLGPSGRAAVPAETPPNASEVKRVRAELERTLAEWAELRSQRIQVRNIGGLSGEAATSEGRAELEARLRTLLTKKRSNREWYDYWAGEKRLAGEVLGLYRQLAPSGEGGEGLLGGEVKAAEAALERATVAADAKTLEVQRLEAKMAVAREVLGKARDAWSAELEGLKASRDQARAVAAGALKALEKARAGVKAAGEDEAKVAAAQAKLGEAEAAAAKAEAEAKVAEEALASAETRVKEADALLGGEPPNPGVLLKPPGPAAEAAKTLGKQAELLRQRRARDLALQEKDKAAKALADARSEPRRLAQRQPALEAWAALAGDKMANQDRYYAAINRDIEAVEERVRGLAGKPSDDALGLAKRTCETEPRRDETALERYYECTKAAKTEIRAVEDLVDDTEAQQKLAAAQTAALATLLEAQVIDERLVERELKIAHTEHQRALDDRTETEPWRSAWATYDGRAATKRKELQDAVRTTKDTQRTLKVNDAFFTSELATLGQRKEQLGVYLDAHTSSWQLVRATVATAWAFLRGAWPVPIYLFLAWFLLGWSKRIAKRVIARAQADDDSTRDERQRAETLTQVTRGAFKLLIIIGTSLLCLDALTVDIGPILGGAAIFGLAISFGSQSLVKDFVTGFFILLENQYAVGDVIEADGHAGTVEAITFRRTVLRDIKGAVHSLPNGAISAVVNSSQGWSRVVCHIGVAYGTDLELVQRTIDRVGDELYADPEWHEKLDDPPRYVGLTEFGDSAITVLAWFKTRVFENWGAERAFNARVKAAFEEAGIEMPFPQQDVHLIPAPPQPAALQPAVAQGGVSSPVPKAAGPKASAQAPPRVHGPSSPEVESDGDDAPA